MNRIKRELQTIGDAELVENIMQMILDRLFADEHLFGHLFILITLGDQRHDFAFARR